MYISFSQALDVHLFNSTHTHFVCSTDECAFKPFLFQTCSISWPYACLVVSFMQCLTHTYWVYEEVIALYENTQSAFYVCGNWGVKDYIRDILHLKTNVTNGHAVEEAFSVLGPQNFLLYFMSLVFIFWIGFVILVARLLLQEHV